MTTTRRIDTPIGTFELNASMSHRPDLSKLRIRGHGPHADVDGIRVHLDLVITDQDDDALRLAPALDILIIEPDLSTRALVSVDSDLHVDKLWTRGAGGRLEESQDPQAFEKASGIARKIMERVPDLFDLLRPAMVDLQKEAYEAERLRLQGLLQAVEDRIEAIAAANHGTAPAP